ncbi:SDR family oxidoreductase [Hyphococcus sp.]|uniref:SDR family oxidoreductase n=1 Tax=Hyphococcus sp. TaxID=2038636 RepID=UPI0035C7260C
MRLKGKTAIITGASSGIGAASARLFAREGAALVLGARRKLLLDDLVDEINAMGGTAAAVCGDVCDSGFGEELAETAMRYFGRLDIGFNNAGILRMEANSTSITPEVWRETIETNLTGAFLCACRQIPLMLSQGGSIIFTSSFVGHGVGLPGMTAYAASKAGLIGMAQCLAAEYGAQNIRVNALLPGGTRTDMAGDFSDDPDAAEMIATFHALKRMAKPEEIARSALFLASDEASFVTGSAMFVDGGNAITKL